MEIMRGRQEPGRRCQAWRGGARLAGGRLRPTMGGGGFGRPGMTRASESGTRQWAALGQGTGASGSCEPVIVSQQAMLAGRTASTE